MVIFRILDFYRLSDLVCADFVGTTGLGCCIPPCFLVMLATGWERTVKGRNCLPLNKKIGKLGLQTVFVLHGAVNRHKTDNWQLYRQIGHYLMMPS